MSHDPRFEVQTRSAVGSIPTKHLRRQGLLPGVIYGHGQPETYFSLPLETVQPVVASGHRVVDFVANGQEEKALIQDVQYDFLGTNIMHIDLLRVDATERVSVDVTLVLRGIAAGVLSGGLLEQNRHSVPVECLAIRIPDNIPIRVNDLKIGDAVHVSDVAWPEGLVCKLPPGDLLVHVVAAKVAEPVAAAAPAT